MIDIVVEIRKDGRIHGFHYRFRREGKYLVECFRSLLADLKYKKIIDGFDVYSVVIGG